MGKIDAKKRLRYNLMPIYCTVFLQEYISMKTYPLPSQKRTYQSYLELA
jgi:hypothetical protein